MGLMASRVKTYMEASDAIWLISSNAASSTSRWCMWVTLSLCEVTSLMPPPPDARLRWVRLILNALAASVVTTSNQYFFLSASQTFTEGFSTVSQVSFLTSTVMTAVQPTVLLLNNLVNFTYMTPAIAALLMPPLRFHAWFVIGTGAAVVLMIGKHPWTSNLLEFAASVITLSFDTLIFYLTLAAQDKFSDVNGRLSAVGRVRPELRALVLESAARQYELTADQIEALSSMDTIGLPLACNSIRHRVKTVTDSFLVYRAIQKGASMHGGDVVMLTALLLQLTSGVTRIIICATAGDRLSRESQRTEYVLGAINTIGWPDREQTLVERIIRNSRRGVSWSMGGLACMDHAFFLSVIGSTVAYLVVLVQYKDPDAGTLLTTPNSTTTTTTTTTSAPLS